MLGSHFLRSSRCFFGSEEATITWYSEGSLACVLPQGRELGSIAVTIRLGDADTEDNDHDDAYPAHFEYQDDPYAVL